MPNMTLSIRVSSQHGKVQLSGLEIDRHGFDALSRYCDNLGNQGEAKCKGLANGSSSSEEPGPKEKHNLTGRSCEMMWSSSFCTVVVQSIRVVIFPNHQSVDLAVVMWLGIPCN